MALPVCNCRPISHPVRSYGSTTSRRKDRRAAGATREGRDKHFADLQAFLVENKVMTSGGKWIAGSNYKNRILNLDECPSPLDGGKSGAAPKKGYREKGGVRRSTRAGAQLHRVLASACGSVAFNSRCIYPHPSNGSMCVPCRRICTTKRRGEVGKHLVHPSCQHGRGVCLPPDHHEGSKSGDTSALAAASGHETETGRAQGATDIIRKVFSDLGHILRAH